MKKFLMVLVAALFLGSTTGMVFAQAPAGADKTMKAHKGGKKGHKGGKKSKKGAETSAPAAAPATTK